MKKKTDNEKYTFSEEGEHVVNDSSVAYQTSSNTLEEHSLPAHVLADIRLGLEQYDRGECRSVNEYMAKYR